MLKQENKARSYVTFGPVGSVALQRHTLVVVGDPQDSALLRTRCLRGAAGQDDPDLPPAHVQVSALPHVHVLSGWVKGPELTCPEHGLSGGRIRLCWTGERGTWPPSRPPCVRRSPAHRALKHKQPIKTVRSHKHPREDDLGGFGLGFDEQKCCYSFTWYDNNQQIQTFKLVSTFPVAASGSAPRRATRQTSQSRHIS